MARHVKGCHYLEVGVSSSGRFYCNDCTNSRGNSKRFEDFDDLLEHLEDKHGFCDMVTTTFQYSPTSGLYKCFCGFGSSNGATDTSMTQHVKGCHDRDVGVSSSGFFYCNDCTNSRGYSKRFESFDDLLEHLEDNHYFDDMVHPFD